MSLAPGSRLGQYEILSRIGAGGMGEVYQARDSKLGRDVAIKVLPDAFLGDPDRVARFAREARALAALNHPNIAQIFGLEESGRDVALVMELVRGEDLSTRIARGSMPLDEAWPIARQVADAIEAAHEAGIVHRDLKPANIKVRDDGTVKVLDFGLAKAIEGDAARSGDPQASPANSPTLTARGTELGIVLGTAAYMAPEQARGRSVDKRADIWAFGCVLYEMLTGRPAFAGETVTDILAAIVKTEPDWNALPASTPTGVRAVLRRCLAKDARERLRDIGDARLQLAERDDAPASPVVGSTRRPARRALVAVGLAGLTVGLALGITWQRAQQAPAVEWTGSRIGGSAIALYPRVSPDGRLVAFLAMVDSLTQVAVMQPDTGNWTVLTRDRTKGLADSLAWSADGSRIYYDRFTDVPAGIYSVPALGGDERLLLENASAPVPLADGSLLLLRINADRLPQLNRFWPDTGRLEPLPAVTTATGFGGFVRPLDGERVAVFGRPATDLAGENQLHVLALSSGQMTRFGPELPPGDASSMTVEPQAAAVLVAVRDGSTVRVQRIPLGDGREPASLMTFLSRPFLDASADGSIILSLLDRHFEVVCFDAEGGRVERWAGGPTLSSHAVGLPDGRYLVTERLGATSRVLVAARGREPVRLVETTEDTRAPLTPVGPDRVALLIGAASARDIAVVAVESGRILTRLEAPGSVDSMAASPDGTTIYVTVDGTIYAMPVGGGDPRTIGEGDSVTVDPDTGALIAKLDELERFRLVRIPPGGGTPESVRTDGGLRMVSEPLVPGAIRNGRLLVPVATADSWYWFVAVLDLESGRVETLSPDYFTDFHFATWAADGGIIGTGLGVQSALWRFAPHARPAGGR